MTDTTLPIPNLARNTPNPETLPIKLTLLVTSTLTVMAAATIAPSLPAMQAHFANVTNVETWVRLVLTMPALFIVLGAPLAGFVIDRFGRKSLLVLSTFFYAVAGSSGFVLESLFAILAGRALLGLAVAGIMTSVTTLIADYYSGAARAQVLGMQAAFMGLGGTIFLTLGGFLADVDWRQPFLIYLIAFAVVPFLVLLLYEPRREQANPLSSQPLADCTDCVAEATRCHEDMDGATSVTTSNRPVLPIRLLAMVYSAIFLVQVIFYLVPVQLPFHLEALFGATASQSGLAVSAMAFCFATGSLLSARISRHVDHIPMIALSFGIAGMGYLIIGTVNTYGLLLVGLAIGGLGFGFIVPNLNVWLTTETPEALRGRVLGMLATFVFLGQFLSPILTQPVIQATNLGRTYWLAGVLLAAISILIWGSIRVLAKPAAH